MNKKLEHWSELDKGKQRDAILETIEDEGLTKEKIRERIFEMLNECMKDGDGLVDQKITSILGSGAIDLESYEDNYLLPKIILTTILKDLVYQYAPLSDEGKKEVENLSHF